MENKNNYGKAAFILSIVADIFVDVSFIIVLYIYGLLNMNIRGLLYVFLGFSILAGPIVMGIIALSMIKQAKGTKRVFVVLTRIFSILSIVSASLILFYYTVVVLFVGAFMA